jgi:filamentous hemagglutinin family protein
MRARAGVTGLAAASVSLAAGIAHAQVVTDGSLGPATTVAGPNYFIHPLIGQTRGPNLFHSFSTFNIGSGESAFFGTVPGTINIVARVTGNAQSVIDGFVHAPANLYLLNPRGILFGANAALDVTGSFHASTADYLRFSDGERFQASLSGATSLSVASPAAFGFTDGVTGAIAANGSFLVGTQGSTLSLVGGQVTLNGVGLSVERGTIAVVGAGSAGEVIFGDGSFDTSSFTSLADVRMSQSFINGFDEESTSVYIRGGRFVMEDQSLVNAIATLPGPDRVIDVDVQRLELANSAAILATSTGAAGGIPIRIRADDIVVGRTAAVSSFAAGSRVGGDIDVQTGSLTINGGETIDTGFSLFGTAAAQGTGGAGNVTVHATSVAITGGGLSALTTSAGDGGDVTLVADRVALHAGATVTAGTATSGNGGRVSVTAGELVLDAGTSAFAPAITVTTNSIDSDAGDAGTIDIHVEDLRLSNGHILSSTAGPGNGGPIEITAQRALLERGASIASDTGVVGAFGPASTYGDGGSIRLQADSLQLLSGSRISAITFRNGVGGNIAIAAEALDARDAAAVNTNAFGTGHAGRIDISGGSATVSAGAAITASSFGHDADAGDANDITISVGELTVAEGGRISNATQGSGAAGDIVVSADRVSLHDNGAMSAETSGAGNAGAIRIDADELHVRAAQITSSTRGAGNGGTIDVHAGNALVEQQGSISADTLGSGTGGTIAVTADRLQIDGVGSGISANTGSIQTETSGVGGNVQISAGQLAMSNRATISAGTFGSGTAGRITIDAAAVQLAGGSAISTASFGQGADAGDANSITISARAISLSDSGQVTTATHGAGAAGRLQIDSDDLTLVSGGLLQSSSLSLASNAGAVGDLFIDSDRVVLDGGSINARSAGGGGPGSIAIRSNSMLMTNAALISAVSTGSSDAGSIGISAADSLQLERFSRITTEAQLAAGGNIALIVGKRLFAFDSTISTSVLGGSANGGNILIDPILVLLDDSAIVAQAIGGNGGAIDIVTELLLRSGSSVIDASSQLGIAGRIGIVGLDADLNADIAPLPSDFLDAQQWLAQPCANRLGTDVSRFTVVGRDGAYRSPLDYMPSPLAFDTPDTMANATAGVLDVSSFDSLLAGIRCH